MKTFVFQIYSSSMKSTIQTLIFLLVASAVVKAASTSLAGEAEYDKLVEVENGTSVKYNTATMMSRGYVRCPWYSYSTLISN